MMISRVDINRTNDDGEPDPAGYVEITFFDDAGLIVASAVVKRDGRTFAHAISGGKVTARALMEADQTDSDQ